jgi:putative ABC transport system substrate-binding protein
LQAAAAAVGVEIKFLHATTPSELDAAFAGIPQQPGNAMLVSTNSFFYVRREQIAALATRFGDIKGGLEAFVGGIGPIANQPAGSDVVGVIEACRHVGRILKGEKPADLPVMQEPKFALTINMETAKALGVAVPPTLLAIADEVIE